MSDTPGTKAMLASFKKYEPGLTSNSNGNGEADEAWVNGLLPGAGMEAGHPATPHLGRDPHGTRLAAR